MLLNDIYAGAHALLNTYFLTDTPECLTALLALQQVTDDLRAAGIPEDTLMHLEAAENRVKAVGSRCFSAPWGTMQSRSAS